ncbi:MAG: hypothetical protein ACFE0J_20075 [Elainellaceae cyanobacterium]
MITFILFKPQVIYLLIQNNQATQDTYVGFHPIQLIVAWIITMLIVLSIVRGIRDAVTYANRLHRVPCANCQFFTGNYTLKCAIHPTTAMSESAIDCPDYKSNDIYSMTSVQD